MRSQLTISATLVLLAGTAAWAQKIAVVDMQGAILQTKEGQQASTEIKQKFGPKEQEISKRSQDLVSKQQQYQKTSTTMSDTAKANAEREITTLQKALTRDTDDARADVQQEENRLLGGILQKMQMVLQKFAADKQLAMIVDISSQPNNLLYADKSVNVTAEVISLYDKTAASPTNPSAATTPKPPASAPAAPAIKKPATTTPGKP